MQNQKKAGFKKLNSMNRVFLNADEHERGRFMHTAIKSMPWLICASAAWLTLVPCGMAFAESYPPLDNNNTKYSIKGEEAGKTISGGNLSLSSVTDNIWYVIANWAQAGNAIKGTTTLLKNFVLGNNTVLANGSAPTKYAIGSYAPNGTANSSYVYATKAIVYGDMIGGDGAGGAHLNRVEIQDTTVSRFLYGGRCENNSTENDSASDNIVIVRNSTVGGILLSNGKPSDGYLVGGFARYGNAQRNQVKLTGSTINAYEGFYGGHTCNGNASNNVIEVLSKSTIQGIMAGGYAITGTANSNSVTVSGGSSVPLLYGGYAYRGSANSNSVSGTDSTVGGDVYGGQGTTGASSNTVDLDNVKVSGKVRGGKTTSGDASGNKVTLSNKTTFAGDLYAGYTKNGNATGNEVSLYDVSAPGNVYASYTANGQAGGIDDDTRSKVTIKKSSVTGSVYGGYTASGTANYSNVVIIDSTFENTGEGTAASRVYAGYTKSGEASHNQVTVSGATTSIQGDVYGGYTGSGTVNSNSVTVNDSTINSNVYAGYTKSGEASHNQVTVSGANASIQGSVYGGWNSNGETTGNFIYVDGTVSKGVTAGYTLSGDAAGNEVLVEGGTVLDHLYGGYTALGSATGNVITVKGGTVNAEMVGGYDDGTATNNTVTLYDSARFTGSDIYGGKSGGSSSDVFTGNTFNVYGQIDAASLQNFQNLNFFDVVEDKASVDLSRSAVIGDGKGSMTNVFIGNLRNQEGNIPEEYVLIHTPTASSSYTGTNLYVNGDTVVTIGPDGSYVPYSGTVANDGTMDNATGSTGMTKSQTLTKGFLTFEVDYFIKNGQDLIARWKKDAPVDVNPETEEFTASRQASAALMDEGADFVAGEGIDRALQASQCLPGEPCGAKAFVAVNGGYSTYKAGTTFDMSYGNMLAGIARQCKIGPVGYLAGVFFETGLSRFHSEYEPDDSRSIDSEGHDYYYGVGALAKVFLNRDLLKGLYAEGSIRYGLMMGDWQSHDIQSDGQTADWDGRAPYLTAHGGLGYMWDVTDNVTADVYAKYFWGHLWGDDGTICGQQFEFDDIYSSRVRTGARLNFKKDETFSWYLGGAWEHQFDSKSRGTIYGYDVPSTDLKGNTAIAEAGVFFKPAADSDFSFMLGTTGYFGEKREGVTGHLQVRYEF